MSGNHFAIEGLTTNILKLHKNYSHIIRGSYFEESNFKPESFLLSFRLCCNLSEDSRHAVMQILPGIVPKQNLSANPPVKDFSPDDIKQYLTEVHLKACVLVVEGKKVKDAYEKPPQRKEDYQGLLETAANRVGN